MNTPLLLRAGLIALCALALSLPAAPAQAQAGSGSRYRVTMSMEVPGMPFQMPGQTSEVCGPKETAGATMVPKQGDDCEVRNFRMAGNKSSFDMVCPKAGMSGSGEFETLGPDRYRGQMKFTAEGQPMLMKFEGQRLGDCDYAKDSPLAKMQQQLAKNCDELLAQPGEALLGAGTNFLHRDAMCANRKSAFCTKIAPLAENHALLRQRSQSEAQMRQQGVALPYSIWDDFQGCGLPKATVLAKACGKAERDGDFGAVAELCPEQVARLCPAAEPNRHAGFLFQHCPERAQALAAQHCAGRDFTALRSSPYAAFCSRAAGQRLQDRQPESSQPEPAAPAQEKKPGLKEKMRGLRDLIGG